MGQISKVPFPTALPGKCFYCGGSQKDSYLDTGIDIPDYGALFICNECTNHLVRVMGHATESDTIALRTECEILKQLVQEYKVKNIALEQAINAMKVAGYSEPDNELLTDLFDHNHPSSSDVLSDSENDVKVFSNGERELDLGESGSFEPSLVEGMADVSASESSDEPKLNLKFSF